MVYEQLAANTDVHGFSPPSNTRSWPAGVYRHDDRFGRCACGLQFLAASVRASRRAELIGFATTGAFISIIVISFVLFAVLGWLLLIGIPQGLRIQKNERPIHCVG